MKNKIRHIILWFVLSVFVTPIAIKSLHIHKHHFVCNAKTERCLHTLHKKCEICDFVLSFFHDKSEIFCYQSVQSIYFYCNLYSSGHIIKSHFLNSLLRAPPVSS